MLLSTAFFPPVEYFALLAKDFILSSDRMIPSQVYLEACEHYQKQSWRNRCRILSAGGPLDLHVPVVHEPGLFRLPIPEIKVDYSTPWVLKLERAIFSAYDASAWFAFYRDDLFRILDSRPETLFDLNLQILRFFLSKTGIAVDLRLTRSYSPVVPDGAPAGEYGADFRERIHPKRPNRILEELGLEKPYFQVFASKYGFTKGLSIMDLVFNEGPDAILYLKNR
mgnify:FL=1